MVVPEESASAASASASLESVALRTLRRLLLAIVALMMLGTAADLLLLEHYEAGWQLTPFIMIALGLVVVVWVAVTGSALAVSALRIVMVLFIATGMLGIMLHYQGNWEFQHELDPTAGGWEVFVKVMRAKAPPALAPAGMIQIGLLGLLYTYRHPGLVRMIP